MMTDKQVHACFETAESYIRDVLDGEGPLLDGTMYSPSDRAIPGVETAYQNASGDQFENLMWSLDDLYTAHDLYWEDGMLHAA